MPSWYRRPQFTWSDFVVSGTVLRCRGSGFTRGVLCWSARTALAQFAHDLAKHSHQSAAALVHYPRVPDCSGGRMSGPCLKRRQAKILLLSAILSTVALAQSGLASASLSAPPGGTILLAQSGPGAPNQRDQIEDAPRARRKAESTAQLQVQWQQAPGQQTGPL